MEGKASSCQARILVVDPEDWCREFLSAVMKLSGFEDFKLVRSLDEALAAMEECPYDLVITDLKTLEYRRLQESRSRHPHTHFIVMVRQRAAVTQQLVYMEQVEIVYKPLSLDDIIRKIRDALHRKQLRQAEEELKRLRQSVFRLLG